MPENRINRAKPNILFVDDYKGPGDLVTDEILKEFKESLEQFVEKTVAENDRTTEIPPAVVVFHIDNYEVEKIGEKFGMAGVRFKTATYSGSDILPAESGREMCEKAGHAAFHDRLMPACTFLISEAWIARYDKDKGMNDQVRPSENPTRREVVIISGMTLGKVSTISVYNIKRRDDNTISLVKDDTASTGALRSSDSACSSFFESYAEDARNQMPV